MTLASLNSLKTGYDLNDMMDKFVEWRSNGNGSLTRILPICLYMYEKQKAEGLTDEAVIEAIHDVSALTHAHVRSQIACGLYFFMVREIGKFWTAAVACRRHYSAV